jgi:hypothetical protein
MPNLGHKAQTGKDVQSLIARLSMIYSAPTTPRWLMVKIKRVNM